MYYPRKYESDIRSLLKIFPAVGIVGPRQAGKTTLVKKMLKEFGKKTIYLDLERNSDYNKLSDPELFLTQFRDSCVVIDEVQRMPELFPLLRSLIDERRENGRFILLGSASPDLLRQSSESLAGRIAYVEIMPFDLTELPPGIGIETNWFRGGFPEALLSPDDETAIIWLENFIKTYTERDLPLLGLTNSPVFLFRFWTMLSHFAGRLVKYSDIADSLDTSINTIKRYIDFFEKAYLIGTIPPYFANISKRLVKAQKLYFQDTGILHRLWGVARMDDLFGHPLLGSSWENYAMVQIIRAAGGRYDISYYRTHDGAELDLILTRGKEPEYAIELKYSSAPTLSRGNTTAFGTMGAKNNRVICPSGSEYTLKDNISVCGLEAFISGFMS